MITKRFKFSLRITIICLTLTTIMLWCAQWQWSRYLYKSTLVATYREDANTTAPSLPSSLLIDSKTITATELAPFLDRRVHLKGTYDYSRQVIVTNRKHASGPGHWLMTPLKLDGSENYVIVSRGFIPFADRKPPDWEKYNFSAEDSFDAVVKKSSTSTFLGPRNPTVDAQGEFQTKWFFPEIDKMAKQLPYHVHSEFYLQRIGPPPHGDFPAQSILVEVPPSTHFGYTIEWVLLAIFTLTIGFLVQAFPRASRPERDLGSTARANGQLTSLSILLLSMLSAAIIPFSAQATEKPELVPEQAGVTEQLNSKIDTSLTFATESGELVQLKDLILSGRPAVVVPMYYGCPRLCKLTSGAVATLLNKLDLNLGADFSVISVSFNDLETADDARKQATRFHKQINRPGSNKSHWHFLTGTQQNIAALMSQIGFYYAKDGNEFSHTTTLVVLTPEGKISRYFYGIEFPPTDVRLALVEAGKGRIGTTLDRVLLFCYRFDPTKGKYTLVVMQVMNIACLTVLGLLVVLLGFLRIREKRNLRNV